MKLFSKDLRKKVGRMALLTLTATMLLTMQSCFQDGMIVPEIDNGDETLVTLSLNVPAATRSLTETEEDAVKNIQVLAFETTGNTFAYSANSSNSADGRTFTVTLRKGTWNLVVLANAADAISGISVGDAQTTVLDGLTKSITAGTGWNTTALKTTGIPMSSVAITNQVIGDQTPAISNVNIYRMVSKVEVSVVDDALTNFELQSVRVYNYETTGKVYPTITAGKPVFVSEPTSTKVQGYNSSDKLVYTAGSVTACTNEIYLNPAAAGAKTTLDANTCLVIGGKYAGESTTTYYRVDFSKEDGTYIDLIRNHKYMINITKVGGRGETDENSAFDSAPVNMSVVIVPWDQSDILEIITNGQYALGVNRKEFGFFKDAVSEKVAENKLVVSTTYTDSWSVSVMNGASVATSGWLKVQAETGAAAYSLTSTGTNQQNFYLQAEANTGSPRTATIHVTAGNLTHVLTVTQSDTSIALALTDGTNEVEELIWSGDDISAKSLVVNWTPGDRNCTITSVAVNGGGFQNNGLQFGTGGITSTTTSTGSQTFSIVPTAITESTPGYPFIDRSSTVTFTLNCAGTTITKTVLLRQIGDGIVLEGFRDMVLRDAEGLGDIGKSGDTATALIKSRYAWTVEVDDPCNLLVPGSYPISGEASTAGTPFTYKVITLQEFGGVIMDYITFTFKGEFGEKSIKVWTSCFVTYPNWPFTEPTDQTSLFENTYVNAFWRADERGERLITMPIPEGFRYFIYTSLIPSPEHFKQGDIIFQDGHDDVIDPRNPDEIGKYVDGDRVYLAGIVPQGGLKFRIGLKTKWNEQPEYNISTAPARYATVHVYFSHPDDKNNLVPGSAWSEYCRVIMLRQGHEADYFVTPEIPASWGGTYDPRPLSVKISPYNLTASEFNAGSTQEKVLVRNNGSGTGVFTQYPTQAGAHFRWAHTEGVYAYNPSGQVTGWNGTNTVTAYWGQPDPNRAGHTIADTYESCPPGYRRWTDGSATNTAAVSSPSITTSEYQQSLNAILNGRQQTDFVWGYCADGFFDRRPIQSSSDGAYKSTVDLGKSTVGYAGLLYYNSLGLQSIFFPAAGGRDTSDGALYYTGSRGYYWSSSALGTIYGYYLDLRSGYAGRTNGYRYPGLSVRCVAASE